MTGFGDSSAVDASISVARLGADPEVIARRAEEMQRLGIHQGVLVADRRGRAWDPDAVNIDPGVVARAIDRHAGIFSGALGVDPGAGATIHGALRSAVAAGFVAAHIVPHAYGLAPDDRRWYPTYAACAELEIPVQIELGVHKTPGSRIRSVGRPIALDEIACVFPELRIIAMTPWPWTEEAISMAYKHDQVYLAVGSDDPGARDPSLVRFCDSWGRGKVMFASAGFPLASALATIEDHGLRATAEEACLRGVAQNVYGIPDGGEADSGTPFRFPER
ncbi:MAG: amidohydrolase family protein [Acidimicrobiia bacterium]|nr:amidohydrolase family protein [Acidimicrobiia bacterium]